MCQICISWKLCEKWPACRQTVTPVHTNSQSWNIKSTFADKCRQNGSKVQPISPQKEPWISLEGPCVSQIISVSPTRPHPLSKVDGSVPRSQTVNFRTVRQAEGSLAEGRTFRQQSNYRTPSTFGTNVVQIWSRTPRNYAGSKSAYCTERSGTAPLARVQRDPPHPPGVPPHNLKWRFEGLGLRV